MASSLFTLLDDIASVLDDVAAMTKIAAKKTAGVLGDDLALNAEQVTGVSTDRELPVVWAVAKGSAVNKVILVPLALLISVTVPWLITPLLMFGGAFLCFEGFEKVAHKLLHPPEEDAARHQAHVEALVDPKIDLVALERSKVKGAIRTDLILSGEIVVISLGTVAEQPFVTQVGALIAISALMTVGVYGLVAGIVKLDDGGLALSRKSSSAARALGRGLVAVSPWLMKGLSIAGTAAMFLVGGGILVHGIAPLHHFATGLGVLGETLVNAVTGIVAGGLVVGVVTIVQKVRRRGASGTPSAS